MATSQFNKKIIATAATSDTQLCTLGQAKQYNTCFVGNSQTLGIGSWASPSTTPTNYFTNSLHVDALTVGFVYLFSWSASIWNSGASSASFMGMVGTYSSNASTQIPGSMMRLTIPANSYGCMGRSFTWTVPDPVPTANFYIIVHSVTLSTLTGVIARNDEVYSSNFDTGASIKMLRIA